MEPVAVHLFEYYALFADAIEIDFVVDAQSFEFEADVKCQWVALVVDGSSVGIEPPAVVPYED